MIRRAAPKDAAPVCAIINAVIAAPHITFRTTPRRHEEIVDLIAGQTPVWVIEDQGTVQGYATYGPFRGSDGYAACREHAIALAPEAQGKGMGRALMTALEAHARADGVHTLVAGVSAANGAGLAFHKALGFVQAGVLPAVGQKAGAWQDLVFLVKQIGTLSRPQT